MSGEVQETKFNDPLVQSYLADKEIAVLASINPDGSPLATPMWFVHDGDGIGMVSVDNVRKTKNLRLDPRVGVVVESGSGGSIECVIVQGSVEFLDTKADRESLGAKFVDKYGAHMEQRWGGRAVPDTRVLFRIVPNRVKLWGALTK